MNDDVDLSTLSLPEIEAFGLARAAVQLDQARANRDDKGALAVALEQNLQLWVTIKTLVAKPDCALSQNVKDNLIRLSNFVADTTFKYGIEITDEAVNTLTNINLQISEGLLEGQRGK